MYSQFTCKLTHPANQKRQGGDSDCSARRRAPAAEAQLKAGTLVLHHGTLVLTRAAGGKERDRFDLVASGIVVRVAPGRPAVLEVLARGGGGARLAVYVFETVEQTVDWISAIQFTQAWLLSSA